LYKISHHFKVITWGKVVLLIQAAVSDVGLYEKPRFVTVTNSQWQQCCRLSNSRSNIMQL